MAFDVVLRRGRVVDGRGTPGRTADVGIVGERIAAVGDLAGCEAGEIVDCRDLVVCPGFVDVHTHSDFTHLLTPGAESLVHQGVTTEVVGNCGFSAAPWRGAAPELQGSFLERYGLSPEWADLDGYLHAVDAAGSSINCATLVGHGTIRAAVIGMSARAATPDEIRRMVREVELAMEQGAVGLSTGLAYAPGSAATAEEIAALVSACSARGGLYTTHVRSEDVRLIESVAEALDTASAVGARAQLSHHPAKFPSQGRSGETLAMLDGARARGVDVACDLHPYTAGATWMIQLLPSAGLEAGLASLSERLHQPAFRRAMRERIAAATDMVAPVQLIRAGLWDKLRIDHSASTPELIGRNFADLAAERRQDPFDTLFDVMAAQGDGLAEAVVIAWVYDESDVEAVMRHASSMIGSDGYTLGASGPLAEWRFHPRSYGTFPRVLARYVRERSVLSLETAVRKMTSEPAERFRLGARGTIATGYAADVVAFDPLTVRDRADYDRPNTLATGIRHVWVRGVRVIDEGTHSGARPGRALRRAG